ncbi:MAG: TetR/AcrR family transcriptional regulator [Thermodesulfobacteriota bacterium]|nr:TetR/AcrR family transcriptional regulator [Thermodesulfobacteriota bacterium]
MDRKESILKAAIILFAERGFNATPTSEIAKRAGVAEGLIFHYFKNKGGILVHILEEMMDAYIQGLEANMEKAATGLEAIENIIAFHLRFSEKRSKEFIVVIRDFPFDLMKAGSPAMGMITEGSVRISHVMRRCIERGIKDGSIQEVPVEETVFLIRGLLNGLIRLKMLGTQKMPEITPAITDFCHRALATQD